ncbi:hypothetical protein ACFVZC_17290 [Streptomyces marokkonensis]|uniref:Uncharacterized protein n=1 Tax=Streptomyces marokkonensis TaxID=324855 RepID=A0ABW6Q7H5_9ACTN
MTDDPIAANAPVGMTQAEFMELPTSERAALMYKPVPDSFENDPDVQRARQQ